MGLTAKLQLRQSQALVMTPQLLQSIRLLQYGRGELDAFVDAEIERNPMLARAPGDERESGESAPDEAPGDAPEAFEADAGADAGEPAANEADDGAGPRAERSGSLGDGRAAGERGFDIADLPETRLDLRDHGLGEVADLLRGAEDRAIGRAIVDHLDDNGYARVDPQEIAAALSLPRCRVDAVLAALRDGAHPAGLFAGDLAGCLSIQLARRGRLDPVIATVLDHLDLLARRDFAALRRLTGEDEAGLMEILEEIRTLDPRPGHAFLAERVETVVPDVVVTRGTDGGFTVELNAEALPRVIVDNDYLAKVGRDALREDERGFVGKCQQSANWLVRSLDQRAKTILKVAREIVRRQDGFLADGVGGLKPMTLMSVAEAISMHESTVSRVTANKFIATPRGTFEMRFFFTVAIASVGGGDAHSAESVKHRIKTLIDAESAGAVLSDDDIAAHLKKEGVDLARRTVAKYREALGLPSSIQRRREMNARRMAG